MPWTNQGGNGGGGPWKPGNQGPWGQGPGKGPTSPDLEEFLRRSQERLRRLVPGGDIGSVGILAVALLVGVIWLASGFYTIAPNEVGLNLVFGKYTGKTAAGLNYNWPYPVGDVLKLPVTDRNAIDIGSVTREDMRRGSTSSGAAGADVPEESLMLTGDENIADVKFRIIWQIDPAQPEYYAFNLRNPQDTVRAVAESAMREVIGRFQLAGILTSDRSTVEQTAQDLSQAVLKSYNAGVLILQTQLLSVGPPAQVIAAYRDVTAAQQDLQRQVNDADSYANRVVPEARGGAARILQEADGYKQQTVQEAQGQASRFDQIYDQYKNAPAVTRQRIYIETMEKILTGADKVIVDSKGGVTPYLPLGALAPAAAPKGANP